MQFRVRLGLADAAWPAHAVREVAVEPLFIVVLDGDDEVVPLVAIAEDHQRFLRRLPGCLSLFVHFLEVLTLDKRPGTSCQVLLSENLAGITATALVRVRL